MKVHRLWRALSPLLSPLEAGQLLTDLLRARELTDDTALTPEQLHTLLADLRPQLEAELSSDEVRAFVTRAEHDLSGLPPDPPAPDHAAAEALALRFAQIRLKALATSAERLSEEGPPRPELTEQIARAGALLDAEHTRLVRERELRLLSVRHSRAELAAEFALALLRRDALRTAAISARMAERRALVQAELYELEGVIGALSGLDLLPALPPEGSLPAPEQLRAQLGVILGRLGSPRAEVEAQAAQLRAHAQHYAELALQVERRAAQLAASDPHTDLLDAQQRRFEYAQLRAAQQVQTHRIARLLLALGWAEA